jgi:hypothetical protein
MAVDSAFGKGVGAITDVFDLSPLLAIVSGFRSITCRTIGGELICLGSGVCLRLRIGSSEMTSFFIAQFINRVSI